MQCPKCGFYDVFTPTCPACGQTVNRSSDEIPRQPEPAPQQVDPGSAIKTAEPAKSSPQKTVSTGTNTEISFHAVKCPNCAGELNYSGQKRVVKCSYCNSDIIIKDDKASQGQAGGATMDTLMELALTADKARNYPEAYKYYTKVLERDSSSIPAWYGKGTSSWLRVPNEERNIKEVITCFEKIIELDPANSSMADQMSEFICHILKEYFDFSITKRNELREKRNKEKNFTPVIMDDNFVMMLDGLEAAQKFTPVNIKVYELAILICCEISSFPSINFSKSLVEKANNILDDTLEKINQNFPDWKPRPDIQGALFRRKYIGKILGIGCLLIMFLFFSFILHYSYEKQRIDAIVSSVNYKGTEGNIKNAINSIFSLGSSVRQHTFEKKYSGKLIIVSGTIYDIGVYYSRKYITVMVEAQDGKHYVDVYPLKDFDLAKYKKDEFIILKGVFDHLGTGSFTKHRIEKAEFVKF